MLSLARYHCLELRPALQNCIVEIHKAVQVKEIIPLRDTGKAASSLRLGFIITQFYASIIGPKKQREAS